ncbi:hypothetical protein HTZ84_03265 [Haloterrigena sp. SYSU A558-1]|uniref:Uncharacterized protein n=1 Tax=Haloterrigena gelatinilytica TaxID=2741724 RepID=A0A8J8GP39_9EURY|nr:hypothetical protein [Haloterrigena gelatinilytica]NUB92748.1 hypothetical protein [Haloterrigena gelatinilytica]NUC71337.1 hypothetical protein [Haloterrigena gelatinilytica]
MTHSNEHRPERTVSDESRRTFLEKGVVVTAVASAAASGVTSAQEDDEERPGVLEGAWEGLIFQNDFHPEARFAIVSDTLDWSPNYGGIDDSWFTGYNTRTIRWLNTGEHVQLFVADEADIGQYDVSLGYVPNQEEGSDRPLVFEVSPEWSPFDNDPRLTAINFSPVEEEIETRLLEGDDWWRNQEETIPEAERTDGNATDQN